MKSSLRHKDRHKRKGLFKRAIFAAIFSLLTHAIEWIDLQVICAKLYDTILW